MWKYVTRRIRDSLERSANHFDRRSATVVNNGTANFNDDDDKNKKAPCKWLSFRKCCNSYGRDGGANSKRWSFEQLNRTWMDAITWSSAVVLGWYTSQLIHLKLKKQNRLTHSRCQSINNLLSILNPYLTSVNKNDFYINSVSKIGRVVSDFTPTVYLMSNDQNESEKGKGNRSTTASTSSPDTSDDDLGVVLNSIENRLGLAAIENGQYQDGLNLLRSAANRNHAPAMYNLGLCYELGLGVTVNEKTALDLYKSAAALNHPEALYNLGIYYGQGRGGLKTDRETATRLLRLAAVQGQQNAIDALKTMDVNIHESRQNDTWTYQKETFPSCDNMVPTQTRLFIDNLSYLQARG
ncbi:unnamed protein product [Chrysodeixis includens]|uniref:Uncharacterized protein n=1 Tax=Chrysodeixis includens TaxID=689277 RepID=A0A9P0FW93_CHRIL|nr:unnamed protein product [Chrysodeixis includens]